VKIHKHPAGKDRRSARCLTRAVTSFDQISRLVAALGGRLVIEVPDTLPLAKAKKDSASENASAAAKLTEPF
jgi:hypothetical protein